MSREIAMLHPDQVPDAERLELAKFVTTLPKGSALRKFLTQLLVEIHAEKILYLVQHETVAEYHDRIGETLVSPRRALGSKNWLETYFGIRA